MTVVTAVTVVTVVTVVTEVRVVTTVFFYYHIIGIKINVITNRNEERYVGR